MEKSVYLLYECDQWLSRDSMVLMGIFTSEEKLLNGLRDLIQEHLEGGDDYFNSDEDEDFVDIEGRIVEEFCASYQTQGYEVNFYTKIATLDKLEEI